MKAERLEDLGRVREKINNILMDNSSLFDKCVSKHTINKFIEEYNNQEKLEDLHNSIRRINENLNEIHYITIGENYD